MFGKTLCCFQINLKKIRSKKTTNFLDQIKNSFFLKIKIRTFFWVIFLTQNFCIKIIQFCSFCFKVVQNQKPKNFGSRKWITKLFFLFSKYFAAYFKWSYSNQVFLKYQINNFEIKIKLSQSKITKYLLTDLNKKIYAFNLNISTRFCAFFGWTWKE